MTTHEPIIDSPLEWVAEHIRTYVETDGKQGHINMGMPTLLLTTRGWKSGKLHRTAMTYGRDGENYIVAASSAGSPQNPSWYRNLFANPEVDVQVLADKFRARARTASSEEKAALWPTMTAITPLYNEYQEKSGRDVPLVILERI